MSVPLRIAMWSGPRNISTAMMRAWENRPDCVVSDEPLYGAWLATTGADHPLREAVIEEMETDWCKVAAELTGPVPGGRAIWYQKHMCQHLLENMEGPWLDDLTHVFLIREPEAVARSYQKKHHDLSPDAMGVAQQVKLFERIADRDGRPPPVIDSGQFLTDPEGHLRALCAVLGIEFLPEMLAWPAGPRDSDGPWAPHWYERVWQSTGFAPPPDRSSPPPLDSHAARVAEQCRPAYEYLHQHRLHPDPQGTPGSRSTP